VKTETEIVVEVMEYFINDPDRRALSNVFNGCMYHMQDAEGKTKRCAVGICMVDEIPDFLSKFVGDVSCLEKRLKDIDGKQLDDLMKPEYRGHSIEFWTELQRFHDAELYWAVKGNYTSLKSELKRTFPDAHEELEKLGLL
jgi:hypothetical protein